MNKLPMLQSPFLNSQDCLIWLQCLFCYDGSFQSQSSKVVLQGHLRLWGQVSSCGSLPWQASILLHFWPPSFQCVPAGVSGCLAVGCGPSADCAWNHLFDSSSAALMPRRLLTASYSSARCCRRSSTWATPFAGRSAAHPV